MTWDDVLGYINGAGLGHLATASVQGEPHSALVFVVRRGDDLYFTMRTTSNKARNLAANPRLSVMWQGNGAETYLWGEAQITQEQSIKSDLWNGGYVPFELAHFFGTEDSPGWCAVRIAPTRAIAMVQGEQGLSRRSWRAN